MSMSSSSSIGSALRCPECGTLWTESVTCDTYFHQMGVWELENALYEVHHLMVLSFYLQHPSRYSPQGLEGAKRLLADFLVHGITPQQVRQRDRDKVDSGKRKFKITGTPGAPGSYAGRVERVEWTMTAADVVNRGLEHYLESVKAWAQSVYQALESSRNL